MKHQSLLDDRIFDRCDEIKVHRKRDERLFQSTAKFHGVASRTTCCAVLGAWHHATAPRLMRIPIAGTHSSLETLTYTDMAITAELSMLHAAIMICV